MLRNNTIIISEHQAVWLCTQLSPPSPLTPPPTHTLSLFLSSPRNGRRSYCGTPSTCSPSTRAPSPIWTNSSCGSSSCSTTRARSPWKSQCSEIVICVCLCVYMSLCLYIYTDQVFLSRARLWSSSIAYNIISGYLQSIFFVYFLTHAYYFIVIDCNRMYLKPS